MKVKKFIATAVSAFLAVTLVAGCSGTGGGGDASDEKVQGITKESVVIANSAATSGAYAPVGVPFLAGINAYLDMVNSNGGIDGRKIELKHVDDEFDPAKGAAALTKFVEDDKVFAIVGHFGTPVVAATVDQLKDYGIPSVYFATGIGQLYSEKATDNASGYNLFPVQPIYITEGSIMTAYAAGKQDAKKLGIIYTNDDAGMDMRKGAIEQAKKINGMTVVEQQVAAGAADVSSAVTALKSADVDAVIVAAIQGTMPTIIKEMAAQGVNKPSYTTYVNVSSAMSKAVVDDIHGKFDLFGTGWVDYNSDIAKKSLADYSAHIADEYKANAYAQTGWIAASFFTEGLRRLEGKDVTWASYMKALESAPLQNPFGGQINYADGARLGTQEMNLSKVVPTDDANPSGWAAVEGLKSAKDLVKE